jgi:hypothetical protein
MKKIFFFFAIALISFVNQSCNPESVISSDSSSSESTSSQIELTSDYDWNSTTEVTIALNGTTASTSSSDVTINGSTVTINKSGNYLLSGSLTNGQIIVDADSGIVKIKLAGVTLTNSSTSPFYIKKSDKTIIFLQESTTNSITDASNYSNTDEPNAALFSNSHLAITGTGSLSVKGNYNDGISSDDEVIINNGVISVTAKDDAIRGKNYLRITGGTITAIATSGHALKSDNETEAGYGYVLVDGGTLTLTSSSKDGIHAVKRVLINGGTTTITASASQGLKSDSLVAISGGSTTISQSKEGIESPYIRMIDGSIYINASDDGFNASKGNGGENNDGSLLSIEGGYSVVYAVGDGLDSNGSITMSGGTVVVHGPSQQPEVAIDYNGTFNLSSGFLIASGTNSNMTQGASTSSSQYSLKITSSSSIAAGTLFHIQDASGNDLATFKPAKAYAAIIFSSSSLTKGSTYYIYTGGSCTGTLTDGLYSGGTYSGGTLKKSFTVSSSVTSVTF